MSLAVVLAIAMAGCASENSDGAAEPVRIDWDLSRDHGVDQVEFERPGLIANEITPVESLRLRLPEGEVFRPRAGVVHDVTMDREGEQVENLAVDSQPLDTDEAHELAVEWASQFELPLGPIEDWYQDRVAGRERGDEDLTSTTLTTLKPGTTIGPDGPAPSLEIRYSFEDAEPSIVSMQFFWDPD